MALDRLELEVEEEEEDLEVSEASLDQDLAQIKAVLGDIVKLEVFSW